MRTPSIPELARASSVAALGTFILAAGCASRAPLPSELPAQPVAVEAWPPAECHGRADCARVCVAGEARRCNEAGLMWERSDGTASADLVEAADLYQRACDAGIVDGCRHGQAAIEKLRAGCDASAAHRCTDLGYVYEHGIGVLADVYYAAHFYKMACDAGVPVGCSRLGTLYEEGRGFGMDWAQAARLYAKACEGGVAEGCNDLGFLYEHGRGIGAPDEKRAGELYREGCERGSGMACMNAGILAEREKAPTSARPEAPASTPGPLVAPAKPAPPKRPPPTSPPPTTCEPVTCSS
jgi:TPR repeat protein